MTRHNFFIFENLCCDIPSNNLINSYQLSDPAKYDIMSDFQILKNSIEKHMGTVLVDATTIKTAIEPQIKVPKSKANLYDTIKHGFKSI